MVCPRVPVVEGSSSQDDGVVVGPLGRVSPRSLQGVPEVAPGRVAHDAVWEAPPHQEGKVHLAGQQDRVLVQTQHRLRLYGNVWEKTTGGLREIEIRGGGSRISDYVTINMSWPSDDQSHESTQAGSAPSSCRRSR